MIIEIRKIEILPVRRPFAGEELHHVRSSAGIRECFGRIHRKRRIVRWKCRQLSTEFVRAFELSDTTEQLHHNVV